MDSMNAAKKNELRLMYLRKIKEAYEKYDFSDLFEDLAEDCAWSGAKGKDAVIEDLISGARYMKENNYWHRCTIVQLGDGFDPLECNTAPDGSGARIFLGLLYDQGEICMIDRSPRQTLFFRMDISPDGKIQSFYATLAAGSYRVIE